MELVSRRISCCASCFRGVRRGIRLSVFALWFGFAVCMSPSASAHPWHAHGARSAKSESPAEVDDDAHFTTVPAPAKSQRDVAADFEPFVQRRAVAIRSDARFLYVESNGIPAHPMMVGITAWQQQVPLPQAYRGENAWRIPLEPTPAKNPRSTKGEFLRGAIALAVNGIPIFNPLNNRGEDAFLVGELDEFGGHCGRADDYHYHLPPVHLEKIVGAGRPIAYALDGYPIYGYLEPDGSTPKDLDAFNGHVGEDGDYHYHSTKKYPYLNGGFHGEVVEREGQVDPQPRANPLRPALPPLRGARITAYQETSPANFRLTYEVGGRKGTVSYSIGQDGATRFVFVDPQGRTTTENYSPPRERPVRSRPTVKPEQPARDAPPRNSTPANSKAGDAKSSLRVSSSSLDSRGRLAVDCTCDGKGQSPAIAWSEPPPGTKSFAVSIWHSAPDREKSYWLVYDIPATTTSLPAKAIGIGVVGLNDRRQAAYDPMCSRGPGVKVYHITVFALSRTLNLPASATDRAKLLDSITDITLAHTTLDVEYERP